MRLRDIHAYAHSLQGHLAQEDSADSHLEVETILEQPIRNQEYPRQLATSPLDSRKPGPRLLPGHPSPERTIRKHLQVEAAQLDVTLSQESLTMLWGRVADQEP